MKRDTEIPSIPESTDPHFCSDEEMLAWCEREGIVPVKDAHGNWDWQAAWEEYLTRP